MKEKLNNFQSLEAGTAEFMPALKSLMDELAQCINEEEMVDLPALDKALSSEQSNNLESPITQSWCLVGKLPDLNATT